MNIECPKCGQTTMALGDDVTARGRGTVCGSCSSPIVVKAFDAQRGRKEASVTTTEAPKRGGTFYWLDLITSRCLGESGPGKTNYGSSYRAILLVLIDYVDRYHRCCVKVDDIAVGAEMSVSSTQRRLDEMEALGYLSRRRPRHETGHLGTTWWQLNADVIERRPCVWEDCHSVGQEVERGARKRLLGGLPEPVYDADVFDESEID